MFSDEEINKEAFLGLTALIEPIFPKIGIRSRFLSRLAQLKLTLKVDVDPVNIDVHDC